MFAAGRDQLQETALRRESLRHRPGQRRPQIVIKRRRRTDGVDAGPPARRAGHVGTVTGGKDRGRRCRAQELVDPKESLFEFKPGPGKPFRRAAAGCTDHKPGLDASAAGKFKPIPVDSCDPGVAVNGDVGAIGAADQHPPRGGSQLSQRAVRLLDDRDLRRLRGFRAHAMGKGQCQFDPADPAADHRDAGFALAAADFGQEPFPAIGKRPERLGRNCPAGKSGDVRAVSGNSDIDRERVE